MTEPEKKKAFLTIGELVKKFKKFYPDLTSSKLRFLESKGLISPKRAENSYRVFYKSDVRKIYFILKLQKEHFLPLEVIKQKLESIDFSKFDEDKEAIKDLQLKIEESDRKILLKKFTIEDIKAKYKLSNDYISELVDEGIIEWQKNGEKSLIDEKDNEILRVISELAKFGIKAKHLKLFENSAYRQSSFLQQIVYPIIKSSNKDAYKKASKILFKLEGLFSELHEILFRKINRQFIDSHK